MGDNNIDDGNDMTPSEDGDDDNDARLGNTTCAVVVLFLMMLGITALFVVTCVILAETWDARDTCGSLMWWTLIARLVIGFVLSLGQVFVWCDLEPSLRDLFALPPLEAHETGGLCLLCLGGGPQAEWLAQVGIWTLHCFFTIVFSVAMAQYATSGAACTNALETRSFSHDAFAGVAWTWLALSAMGFLSGTVGLIFGPRPRPY
jgi:hypothetical protein